MKIAYLNIESPENKFAWSGLNFSIYNCLVNTGNEIVYNKSLESFKKLEITFKRIFYKIFKNQYYEAIRDNRILEAYATEFEKFIAQEKPDLIFGAGSAHLSRIKTDIPIVFWADATFENLNEHHNYLKKLDKTTFENSKENENSIFIKASKLIFTSDWAINSAISNYQIDKSKLELIKFGANIENVIVKEKVEKNIKDKKLSEIEILFIGIDWMGKDLQKVLDTTLELNNLGKKTFLHIVGSNPKIDEKYIDICKVYGFVSKHSVEGMELLNDLFLKSHFFFMPSKAEAFGLVFAEASAYGLPSISNDVCGISSVVNNGVNGYLLQKESTSFDYANLIIDLTKDETKYKELCMSSRNEFEKELNWNIASKKLKKLLNEIK
ncbi:MAG: glycosyltransferase family 4 protein [Candidatus Kapabacteria bacterium]|nr:glycosyltransferase family 4 protein [Candidatus Kapabacteria bacterium]